MYDEFKLFIVLNTSVAIIHNRLISIFGLLAFSSRLPSRWYGYHKETWTKPRFWIDSILSFDAEERIVIKVGIDKAFQQ